MSQQLRSASKRRRLKRIERLIVWNTTQGLCANCGTEIPFKSSWHADHVVPFSKTGRTLVTEMQPLCADCNLKKGAKCGDEV